MITITCTNCHASLTMDEAFAGGVCRCQHCGTIQTVPRSARDNGGMGSGIGSGSTGSKALWKQKTVSEAAPGTGLDDLADIVASSGLAGSGLQSRRLSKPANGAADNKKTVRLLMIVGGALAAIIIVLLIVLLTRGGDSAGTTAGTTPGQTDSPGQTGTSGTSGTTAKPPVVSGPNFAGVTINATNVIYVLDRGNGTRDVFDQLKALAQQSVQSLTSGRRFQLVFWDISGEVIAFPEAGPTGASEMAISDLAKMLEDVQARGASNIVPALKRAAAGKPTAVVICSGKEGDDLDEEFLKAATAALPAGAKVYAFSLGTRKPVASLQSMATKSGGVYKHLTDEDLRGLRE